MQKNYLILFFMVLSIPCQGEVATDFKVPALQPINLTMPTNNSDILSSNIHQDLFPYFLRPINFSKEGIAHYFSYTYNHERYTQYLPYNFSHMVQFLEFGLENNQTQQYAQSIIKLFLQKIKACEFIESYALHHAMPQLANALEPYLVKKEYSLLQELERSLKERFSSIFSTYFSYFQKNPDAFLDALAQQIAKKTNEVQTQQHIDIEQVKKDVVRFLEICMNKLIWSPQDGYGAWLSINQLADDAELFLDKKLITNIDALDDLHWSLIHRFCYFVDIAQQDISQDAFVQIINDIHTHDLAIFSIEEQEDLITSKKDHLLRKINNYCPYAYRKALPLATFAPTEQSVHFAMPAGQTPAAQR